MPESSDACHNQIILNARWRSADLARHAIWGDGTNQPDAEFVVEWDPSAKRRRLPATLLGARFKLSDFAHSQHGVVIALLKIAPGASSIPAS